MTRGGKRPGAGRKPTLEPHEIGQNVTFRLPRWMIRLLPENRSQFVRDAIARKLADERLK